jgi:hypothetical protein
MNANLIVYEINDHSFQSLRNQNPAALILGEIQK